MKVDRVTPISLVEIFELKYNSTQKWYWLRDQGPEELVVFVQFDSHCPEGRINGRFRLIYDGELGCPPKQFINIAVQVPPHTTFTDPEVPSHVQPRESIETRSIVFTKLDAEGK